MKKKTLFLSALVAGASLLLLAGCVKNKKKTDDTGVKPTDTTPVTTNTGVKPTTDTSVTPTTVVEDVIVENALFNNSILRVKVANKKIKSIEQFGYDYTAYLPVYDSNNKISYFNVFSTNNSFISSNHVNSLFYELDTDNLLGNLVFHVDTNGNLVIVENKKDNSYAGGVDIDYTKCGYINKVTVSKDGKITKDLSTTDGAYSYSVSDNSIKFEGRNISGKESKVEYTIYDTFDLNLSVTEGSKTLKDLTLSVYDGNINMSYYALYSSSSGDYTFSFENDKLVGTKKVNNGTTTEIEYMYDKSNRLSTIHRKGASDVLSIEHNEVGKISKETYGSSIDQYIFDNEYRVGKKDPTSIYGNLSYISSYNENFQTLVRMENGGHGKQSYEFTYDEKGRETSYRNYYYTSPTSDERYLAYENLYTIGTNGELTCDIYYRYDSTGKVLDGTKTEYSTNGNKEIEKYYRVADVKDVWNLQRETTTEELGNGVVTETTNYSNNLKTSYTRNSKIFDEQGYQTTTTTLITYNESGEVTKTTEYVDGVYDAENNIYLKTTSEDGKVISKNYTAYADSNQNVTLWLTHEEYDSNEDLALSRHTTYETLDDGKLTRVVEKTYENGLVSTYKDTKKEPDGTVYYEDIESYTYDENDEVATKTVLINKLNALGNLIKSSNIYTEYSYTVVDGQENVYIRYYKINDDESKTLTKSELHVYNGDGLKSRVLEYDVISGVEQSTYSRATYYTYNEDDTLNKIEIAASNNYVQTFTYKDGALVSAVEVDDDTKKVVSVTEYNSDGKILTLFTYDKDSNGYDVVEENVMYYDIIFDEYVNCQNVYRRIQKSVRQLESSSQEIVVGEQTSESFIDIDIFTGAGTQIKSVNKLNIRSYQDGDNIIPGYTSERYVYFNVDGTNSEINYTKRNLNDVVIREYHTTFTYTDTEEIDINVERTYSDDSTPLKTITQVVTYTLSSPRDQTSNKKTEVDHTNNDETKSYTWNYSTGEWELDEQ